MGKNRPIHFEDVSNEYMYREYLMHRRNLRNRLVDLKMEEYVILEVVYHNTDKGGKIYLREIAELLNHPTSKVSPLVQVLSDSGYLIWTHDDKGEMGTYVILTESGRDLIVNNEGNIKQKLKTTVDKFGQDKMKELLKLMKEFTETLAETEEE